MKDKISLVEALAQFDEPFSPRIVGYMNDYKLQVAKTKGEFVWHTHPDTDDFFLVVAGELTIQLRDRDIVLGPGEISFREGSSTARARTKAPRSC